MKPSRIRFFSVCCAVMVLAGCLDDDIPFIQQADYHLEGPDGDKEAGAYLGEILDNRLIQFQNKEAAPNSRLQAYQQESIRADLVKAMNAKGYYEPDVTLQVNGAVPASGTYKVEAGSLYHLSSISVQPSEFSDYLDQLDLKTGDILDAAAVLTAQQKLFNLLQKNQCYFGLDVVHGVVLNEGNNTGALTYTVTTGPQAHFGEVVFQGQDTVKVSYLKKLIPWRQAGCYRSERIETLRTRLMSSGLFSRVDIKLPEAPQADDSVPLVVDLKERAPRTVRAGLSYYTDQGAGVSLRWEHRNFFGATEKLQADLTLSQIKQSLDAEFLKPYFLRKDQTLSLTTSLRHQDTDAFKEFGFDAGGSITRKFNRRLSATLGTDFTLSRVEEKSGVTNTYGLVSVPGSIIFDNRDDKLDPHKGWAINGGLTPYFDMLGESNPFLKAQLSASTYYAFGTGADIVLAMRGNVGSIMGASNSNVPATERFYAGGGGSVRGFGYQEVGPQEDGTPTGGRSVMTASSELRFKLTETLGAVTFVDAGSVSESVTPDFDNVSIGAGVGLRYYTGFGPLRFDLAVPLTQRSDLDQNYQIYISIGQAF